VERRREMWIIWNSTVQITCSSHTSGQEIWSQRCIQTKVCFCLSAKIISISKFLFGIFYNIQRLIQQHEVGIRKRLIQRWTPHKPTCDSVKINRKYVSVSIKDILPTIMLFSYGMLISLIVLMLELAYHFLMNYMNNKFKKADKATKIKFKGKLLYPQGDQKYDK